LDNELILQQFDEIEQKVERLIEVCKSLEAANEALKTENTKLADALQGKIEAEKRHTEIRTLIRSKIDSLMSRLEGIAEVENA
jgi:regulator of replication initiation timing